MPKRRKMAIMMTSSTLNLANLKRNQENAMAIS